VWDDSLIIQALDKALRSHQTRGQAKRARKLGASSLRSTTLADEVRGVAGMCLQSVVFTGLLVFSCSQDPTYQQYKAEAQQLAPGPGVVVPPVGGGSLNNVSSNDGAVGHDVAMPGELSPAPVGGAACVQGCASTGKRSSAGGVGSGVDVGGETIAFAAANAMAGAGEGTGAGAGAGAGASVAQSGAASAVAGAAGTAMPSSIPARQTSGPASTPPSYWDRVAATPVVASQPVSSGVFTAPAPPQPQGMVPPAFPCPPSLPSGHAGAFSGAAMSGAAMPVDGDDSLHAVLMAWYYAGYYTGRHTALAEQRRQQQHQ